MSTRKATALAARLGALDITADEAAAIVRRPVEEVTAWIEGDAEPDGEGKILLRLFTDLDRSHAAQLAAERIRSRRTQSIHGEDWQSTGVEVPYGGGFAGADAGSAS